MKRPLIPHLAQQYQDDLVAFLQALVQIPSVNGRDDETAVSQRIVQQAHRLGFAAELVAKQPNRPNASRANRANAIVRWGQGPRKFAIIGHVDTVAEGPADHWSVPPFGGEIKDGRLVGRGTADNKAGIAIGLYTLALLRDHQLVDPNEVELIVAGVVDEESGATSTLGVRHLLDTGHFAGVEGAIYAYASDIVCVGHRGLLRLELTARGQAIHSGLPAWSQKKKGVNAVTGLAAALLALETLQLSAPPHPAFDHLGCTITPGTLIQGGTFVSIVPDLATAAVDIRLMPGQEVEEVLTAVHTTLNHITSQRPGLTLTTAVTTSFPGAAIPSDHPLAQIAQHHARSVTGGDWPIVGAGPGNEGYMLIGAGIPTLCGFGPSGDNAHAPDEWVDLTSLHQTVAVFSGIICDYLRK